MMPVNAGGLTGCGGLRSGSAVAANSCPERLKAQRLRGVPTSQARKCPGDRALSMAGVESTFGLPAATTSDPAGSVCGRDGGVQGWRRSSSVVARAGVRPWGVLAAGVHLAVAGSGGFDASDGA
jgi:hypothetical protein